MVEFASSRLLDEPLKAAIAELERNAAEGRVVAARRVIGEQELDSGKRGRSVESMTVAVGPRWTLRQDPSVQAAPLDEPDRLRFPEPLGAGHGR